MLGSLFKGIGSAISGGLGLLSGVPIVGDLIGDTLGSGFQANWGRREAATARGWQEAMMQRKYQYAVNDLRAAGLNPILAAGGGVSGSGPSGAAANIAAAPPRGQAASARQLVKMQRNLMQSQEWNQRSQAEHFTQLGAKEFFNQMTARVNFRMARLNERMKENEVVASDIVREINEQYGEELFLMERILPAINTASGLAGALGLVKGLKKFRGGRPRPRRTPGGRTSTGPRR